MIPLLINLLICFNLLEPCVQILELCIEITNLISDSNYGLGTFINRFQVFEKLTVLMLNSSDSFPNIY
jgi:hypothetical protein